MLLTYAVPTSEHYQPFPIRRETEVISHRRNRTGGSCEVCPRQAGRVEFVEIVDVFDCRDNCQAGHLRFSVCRAQGMPDGVHWRSRNKQYDRHAFQRPRGPTNPYHTTAMTVVSLLHEITRLSASSPSPLSTNHHDPDRVLPDISHRPRPRTDLRRAQILRNSTSSTRSPQIRRRPVGRALCRGSARRSATSTPAS